MKDQSIRIQNKKHCSIPTHKKMFKLKIQKLKKTIMKLASHLIRLIVSKKSVLEYLLPYLLNFPSVRLQKNTLLLPKVLLDQLV